LRSRIRRRSKIMKFLARSKEIEHISTQPTGKKLKRTNSPG